MNILTRKKTLLATIANLEEQIRIQSDETAKLRHANTDINRLWQTAKKENATLAEQLRAKGIEYAEAIGEKNQVIEGLLADIDAKDGRINDLSREVAELQDANNGLASSVSELKAQLRSKAARLGALTRNVETLKAKLANKAEK